MYAISASTYWYITSLKYLWLLLHGLVCNLICTIIYEIIPYLNIAIQSLIINILKEHASICFPNV